jgi:hypothetical protein
VTLVELEYGASLGGCKYMDIDIDRVRPCLQAYVWILNIDIDVDVKAGLSKNKLFPPSNSLGHQILITKLETSVP